MVGRVLGIVSAISAPDSGLAGKRKDAGELVAGVFR